MKVRKAARWLRARNPLVDHHTPKVFGLGFNKTGTTSLHNLFVGAGLRSFHHPAWWKSLDPSILHTHDAFSDGFPKAWRRLETRYPGSRYVLHVRSLRPWVASRLAHLARHHHRTNDQPFWRRSVRAVDHWIRRRDAHHRDVIAHFAATPERLLVVNLIDDPDAAQRVARFLGHAGTLTLPHANPNPKGRSQDPDRFFERAADRMGLSEEERTSDLVCPSLAFPEDDPLPTTVAAWRADGGW